MNLLYPELAHHEIDRRVRAAHDHRRVRATRRAVGRASQPDSGLVVEQRSVRR